MKQLLLLLFLPFTAATQVHLGPGQAFANIQAAATANAIHPGDTVFLHAGIYAGYQAATLHGTDSQWINIRPYQNDVVDISGGWQFISCSYLKFENLTFVANTAHPGRLFSVDNGGSCITQSRHIVVTHCSFSKVSDPAAIAAFKFGGVDNFEVSHCTFLDITVCSAMDYNVCHDGVIRENHFENCLTGGHIKGGASNITMERNVFINASQSPWVAFELGGDTGAQFYCPEDHFEVKNLKFYSNIIAGGYRGVALSSARDCAVVHNTFYHCGQATLRFLGTSALYPELSNNLVENNLFAFGQSAYINGSLQAADAASFSHNIYFSTETSVFNGPYWDTPALDAIKDPNPLLYGNTFSMFVDAPNQDFHLLPGSPAIASGNPDTLTLRDFYGQLFSTLTPSIGAIEYLSGSSSTDTPVPGLSLFPIPAKDYLDIGQEGISGSRIEIYNSLGIRVQELEPEPRIQVGFLAPGTYILKVGNRVGRFIKI